MTHIQNGFDFLGQNIRKYGRKLLITPAQKNVQAVLTKIREIIEKNKSATQENLINRLNPVIRGWANYHRHCVAKRAFARMDFEIWRKLWWWSYRRHPGKNSVWVKNRYYHAIGERTWRFAVRTNIQNPLGQPSWKKLLYAGNTPIQRHRKIKGEANPFDPRWRSYFAQRGKGSTVRQTVADDRPYSRGLTHGLSRMRGNSHVRFLEEGEAVTLRPYPTLTASMLLLSASCNRTRKAAICFCLPIREGNA